MTADATNPARCPARGVRLRESRDEQFAEGVRPWTFEGVPGLAGRPAAHRPGPAGPRRRGAVRRTPGRSRRGPRPPTGSSRASARTARSAAASGSSSRTSGSCRSRATRTRRSPAAGCARRARPASSWSTAPGAPPRCSTAARAAPSWERIGVEQATDMIADRIVEARRKHWQDTDEQGRPLRRTMGIAAPRRRDAGQRRELPDQEALHRAGRDPDREPGPYLTQCHGSQSGSLVRPGRRHRLPAGPAAR